MQEQIDLTNSEEMKERFKNISISDLCELIREGLNELYCKLRIDEGFDSNIIISGKLDDSYSDVYTINAPSMISGEARYHQIINL